MSQPEKKDIRTSKPNYLLWGLIGIFVIYIAYVQLHKEDKFPAYQLMSIDKNTRLKFSVSIRIDKKLTDDELIKISKKVKSEIVPKSDTGTIFLFLPGMADDNGAWAAVDYLPEASVRMIGQTIQSEKEINAGLDKITDYVGLWSDNSTKDAIINRIRKDKKLGYVFELISPADPKPSELATLLTVKLKNGKLVFIDKDSPDQYFELEDNGDLSVYDNEGFFVSYKVLRLNLEELKAEVKTLKEK